MARKPEIGNVRLYPDRSLTISDRVGYVVQFYCPLQGKRIRRACSTRDRRAARRIAKECQQRLLNGEYEVSGGAITAVDAIWMSPQVASNDRGISWEEASERYLAHSRLLMRPKSYTDVVSRLKIAERIYNQHCIYDGEMPLADCVTVDAMEYLRTRLLEGAETRCNKSDGKKRGAIERPRSPHTVNSMMATVLPFFEHCATHGWCPEIKRLKKIKADDPMKGRPITGEEFDRLIEATPLVVGKGSAASWVFTLQVLWESAFRVQDVMDFSWDDQNYTLSGVDIEGGSTSDDPHSFSAEES